jgi:hypothetical protein
MKNINYYILTIGIFGTIIYISILNGLRDRAGQSNTRMMLTVMSSALIGGLGGLFLFSLIDVRKYGMGGEQSLGFGALCALIMGIVTAILSLFAYTFVKRRKP